MYIVKRVSLSGGMEYLISGVSTKYRWVKEKRSVAKRFTTRSGASRVANRYAGSVKAI